MSKVFLTAFIMVVSLYLATGVGAALQASGPLTYTFSDVSKKDYLIGGVPFKSSDLSYRFGCPNVGSYSAPGPEASCWQARIEYADFTSKVSSGQEVQVNECFAATMTASGSARNGVLNSGWRLTYTFRLTNPDCLKSVFARQKGIYELNQPAQITLRTENLFGKVTGGYYVKYSPLLYPSDVNYYAPADFESGANEHLLAIPSTVLGAANVSAYPYVYFGEAYVIQNEPANRVVQVLPKLQIANLTSECSNSSPCSAGSCQQFGTANEVGLCVPEAKPAQGNNVPVLVGGGSAALAVIFTILIIRKVKWHG